MKNEFYINYYFKKNIKPIRPLIIAEISGNHCGKKSLFLKTIKSAAKNGADLIKIQTYEPEDITIKKNFKVFKNGNTNLWNIYKKAHTPYLWHKDAFKLAKKLKIEIFSTPFSIRAVDFLEKLNVKLYKISSFEITDYQLIKKIASTRKPVIVSTGMASSRDISNCVNIIKKYHSKIILLHCVSGYPTSESQSNLKRIKILKDKFKNIGIGLSDHTNDILTSLTSVAYDVRFIEKHFIISKKLKSLDRAFSIDPSQLKELKIKSKRVFRSLGIEAFQVQNEEKKSKRFRRSIFTIKKIKKNEKLTEKNISNFRPKIGVDSNYFFKVLGKRIKKDISKHEPIFFKDLK